MVKPISTRVHGVLDYMTVGTLIAGPRMMRWDERVTRLTTYAGVGVLGYSLMTRYELGLIKALPMPAHLMLDAGGGMLLAAAPFTLVKSEGTAVVAALIGVGLFEITVAALTRTKLS